MSSISDRSIAGMKSKPMPLWERAVPGEESQSPGDVPTITPYAPSGNASGAAIVVCPGGGYEGLAAHEGEPMAVWLNSLGIAAFVLKYRVGPRARHPNPLTDVTRAMRTVRAHAKQWGVDPARIGVMGSSAGGHLAASVSNHYDDGDPSASDMIERFSSRPDVSILLYPVISMRSSFTHAGSRRNLLGDEPSADLEEKMSLEEQVTARTPPTFIFHTVQDGVVPVDNAINYAAALQKARVPFEMHLYERGPHGVGLAIGDAILASWPARLRDWLSLRGFVAG